MDKLEVGKVIKVLRRENEITQEQLANFIGVSVAAVSKWESGTTYPDITILPVLASFFDVTIDTLMNYRIDLNDEEINKIGQECEMLIVENKMDEGLELTEKYLKKYPNNWKLKYRLSNIYTLVMVKIPKREKQNEMINRYINILEEISNNTANIELKESSLVSLSSGYMMNNQPDKAEEVIKKIYKPSCDPDVILPLIYMQQDKVEEAKKLMQENLYKSLKEALVSSMSLSSINYNYKEGMDEKYVDFEKAEKYIKLSDSIRKLLPDQRSDHDTYIYLYDLESKRGRLDKALDYLEEMIDSIRDINLNKHNSVNEHWCYDKVEDKSIDIKLDIYDMLITALKERENLFKYNKRFENIIKELEILKEKNQI